VPCRALATPRAGVPRESRAFSSDSRSTVSPSVASSFLSEAVRVPSLFFRHQSIEPRLRARIDPVQLGCRSLPDRQIAQPDLEFLANRSTTGALIVWSGSWLASR